TYINDSKATNIDAVYYALEGIDKNIVWIAGGVDKGNEYEQIASLVRQKVSHLICLGTDNKPLRDYFSAIVPSIDEVTGMEDAIRCARDKAKPGEVVLLSPACASFDLFENYMDRGDQFRKEVKRLEATEKNKELK
ncbi:MAG: UDP-N-acetylmuramoyl-L-alanine--D-glutamate ligase, partial [Cyclobacteriaceae bacterium]